MAGTTTFANGDLSAKANVAKESGEVLVAVIRQVMATGQEMSTTVLKSPAVSAALQNKLTDLQQAQQKISASMGEKASVVEKVDHVTDELQKNAASVFGSLPSGPAVQV